MAATVFAFHARRVEARPWQNHELAEFYRVIDALARAGLGIVPDMGVSDEGDPWFAFCCAETGEVIAHCARIDGMFVATSVAVKKLFRGFTIRDVVDAITRSQQLAVVPSGNRRLYLHPAAVLVAFVAAALLFTKEASAHETSTGPNASGQNAHDSLPNKLFAALKFAISDSLGGLPASVSPHAAGPNPGLLNVESPIPLGALTSVAMDAIASALTVHDSQPLSDPSGGAIAQPVNFAGLHPSIDLSLVVPTDHSTEVSALDNQPSTPSGVADSSSSANLGLGIGTLHLAIPATDMMVAPTNSAQSFEALPTAAIPAVVTHVPPPPHYVTMAGSSSASPDSSTAQPSPSNAHTVDLSDLSPVAVEVFFGTPPTATSGETASHAPASVAAASSSGGATDSVGSTPTITASFGGSAATPTTIVIGANPNAAIAQLLDYALTNHPIQAPLAASPTLAADLNVETAAGAHPVRLVVFDSNAMKLPVFDFVQGVVFVDDHELGITLSQVSPAQTVTVDLASGGTMKLLGVIDTAHVTL